MPSTWNLQSALKVIQDTYNASNTACRAAWNAGNPWPPADPKDAQIAQLTAERDAAQAAVTSAQAATAVAQQNADAANVLCTAMTAERVTYRNLTTA